MSVPLTPSADKNWITARRACLEESTARSLTVILLLLQSTTHCRYWVYTKFLLTYSAIYRGNRKVLPLGITALQPQSHFHLGTPYTKRIWFFRSHGKQWPFEWRNVVLLSVINGTYVIHLFPPSNKMIMVGRITWGARLVDVILHVCRGWSSSTLKRCNMDTWSI